MLEHAFLQVQDWKQTATADGGLAWVRAITDGVRSVGFVRLTGNPRGAWLSWLRKVRLDVFETDDVSHVMSLSRAWGMLRGFAVDDADDRHVGNVYTKMIVSSEGDRLGSIDHELAGGGRIIAPTGQVLARFGPGDGGTLDVMFSPDPTGNPFLRMLLLGSILAWDRMPKGERPA